MKEIKVKLNVNITPSQNAQNYYKEYSKNKKAYEYLLDIIKKEIE